MAIRIRRGTSRFPADAKRSADMLIRNTYRTLMTRGMKGCYIYFVDKDLEEHFRQALSPEGKSR